MSGHSPRLLPIRIHAAAHEGCHAGSVAGVQCALYDAIKREIEGASTHVCSYCAETLPVSLDEPENLATARAHMLTCPKHPVREFVRLVLLAIPYLTRAADGEANALLAEMGAALDPYREPGEFAIHSDVEVGGDG